MLGDGWVTKDAGGQYMYIDSAAFLHFSILIRLDSHVKVVFSG